MNIGIIGCGNISSTYFRLAPLFKGLSIVACSDIDDSAAARRAGEFGCKPVSIEALLADQTIDLVINLTIPAAHADISRRVLQAKKHVYSEKPFVLSLQQGQELQALARSVNRRIGSAPDTFLGGAHQQAREWIDSGQVGRIIGGSCFLMNHGMEHWHPNPDFFYQAGGGPMLDMGPYYLSNLVQLVGPVKRLMAMSATPARTRTISSEPRAGQTLAVSTPTSVSTLLEFHNGAQITLVVSWDVQQHEHNCMELYGTEATLHVPDPNFFGGELRCANATALHDIPLAHPFAMINEVNERDERLANYRGAGLADMVAAIEQQRAHRCDDTLALHVVDIMTSALRSAQSALPVPLQTRCERPAALNAQQAQALLA